MSYSNFLYIEYILLYFNLLIYIYPQQKHFLVVYSWYQSLASTLRPSIAFKLKGLIIYQTFVIAQ